MKTDMGKTLRLGLLVALAFGCGASLADDSHTEAETSINAAYKNALTRFSPLNQEVLRRAERAWIVFSNAHEALLNNLLRENVLGKDRVDSEELGEVNARTNHLIRFFGGQNLPRATGDQLRSRDEQLNRVYDECQSRLSPESQRLLQEAGRAWSSFRDLDADSVMAAYSDVSARFAAELDLIVIRTAQLNAVARPESKVSSSNANTSQDVPTDSPRFSPPPDANLIKRVAEWKANAAKALQSVLSEKNGAFLKPAETLKNTSDLPPDLVEQLSTLKGRYAELARQSSALLFDSVQEEYRTTTMLLAWSLFVTELKIGDVDKAGSRFHGILETKPEHMKSDYQVLWDKAENWDKIYAKEYAAFHAHTQRASGLASIGKTSEAIKEYNAAYEIIENEAIARQVKKLREESLGL